MLFRKYLSKQNQSISNIRKLVEDKYGFLWAATQDGLFRFDGTTFVEYNKNIFDVRKRITGSDIRDLAIIRDNIWSINSFGGLDCINLTSLNVISSWHQTRDPQLKNSLLHSLTPCGDSLYISGDKGLFIYNTIRNTLNRPDVPGNSKLYFSESYINKTCFINNNIWLFIKDKGVFVFKQNTYEQLAFKSDPTFFCFDLDISDEKIYTTTTRGVEIFSLKNNKIIDSFPETKGNSGPGYAIAVKGNNEIWYANSKGLFKFNEKTGIESRISESKLQDYKDWTGSIFEILYDHQGRLWIGGQNGIAVSTSEKTSFTAYSKSSSSSTIINHAYYLFPFQDSLLFVCAEDGLYKTNLLTGTIETIQSGLSFFYMFAGENGLLYTSNTDGLFLLNHRTLTPVHVKHPEFKNKALLISSHLKLNETTFLLGTQNEKGLYLWDLKRKILNQINTNTPVHSDNKGVVNNIFLDKQKRIWILGDNYIIIYDYINQRFQTKKIADQTGYTYSIFFDVCQIADTYFIASYGNGVVALDSNFRVVRHYSSLNGLSNNGVYKIIPFRDSLLLVSSNNGLNTIEVKSGKIRNYFSNAGIQSDLFEELSGNKDQHNIYMGGKDGFTVIHPELLNQASTKPIIYFNKAEIKVKDKITDTTIIELKKLVISSQSIKTDIHLAAINWENPEATTYQYRITESSLSWINLNHQQTISFINNNPGTYHLQVQAFNEDGVGSEIKELTLVFLPKWYQTWWFKSLIALALIAIAYGLYRMRINQLRKEEKIRNQLASDLHDDLGSTLNSIKVHSNLAQMEKDNPNHLLMVKQGAQDAINGVRDIIWVLDDKKDQLGDTFARVGQFAEPLCLASKIQYKAVLEDETQSFKLGKEEKRNLYMIFKESINNSLKYAVSSQITLHASRPDKKLRIEIIDNGKGFDLAATGNGYGLRNIRNRAKSVGYSAEIISSPGAGTRILLQKM